MTANSPTSRRALLRGLGLSLGALGVGVGGASRSAVAQTMDFHLTPAEAGFILRFDPGAPAAVIDAVANDGRVVWRGAGAGPTVKHFRLRPGLHALAIGGDAGEILLPGGAYGLLWLGATPQGLGIVRRAANVRPEQLAASKVLVFPPGVRPTEDGSRPVNLQSMGAGVGLVVRAA